MASVRMVVTHRSSRVCWLDVPPARSSSSSPRANGSAPGSTRMGVPPRVASLSSRKSTRGARLPSAPDGPRDRQKDRAVLDGFDVVRQTGLERDEVAAREIDRLAGDLQARVSKDG